MKEKKNLLIVISIMLLLINVFFAFYVFGMPKEFAKDSHHGADLGYVYVTHQYWFKLSENVVGVAVDGEERTFAKGETIGVDRFDPDDNSPIVRDHTGELKEFTLRDAVYEDVTEDVAQNIAQLKEQDAAQAKQENMKLRLWFLHQGEDVYFHEYYLDTIRGDFTLGLTAAGVVLLIDGLWLAICFRKTKLVRFVITNILLCPIMAYIALIWMV